MLVRSGRLLAGRRVRRRQNLLRWSEDFTQAWWSKNAVAVVAGATTAPDSSANGAKLNETATNDQHYLGAPNLNSNSASTSYTISVYAKAGERRYLLLYLNTGSWVGRWFDLQTGAVASGGGTGVVVDAGNGWYRCSLTLSGSLQTQGVEIHTAATDGGASYQGVAGNGIYIWGAQLNGLSILPYLKTV